VPAGHGPGAVQLTGQRVVEDVVDQRRLPRPDTPVTAMKQPSGNAASTFFRLCSLAPLTTTSRAFDRLRRTAGTGIDCRRQVRPGQRLRAGQRSFSTGPETTRCRRARPAPGPRVHHPVPRPGWCPRRARPRSALLPRSVSGSAFQQPVIIPLEQHPIDGSSSTYSTPYQSRTRSGSSTDPLRLATSEGGRRPVQGHVVQAQRRAGSRAGRLPP